MERMLSSILSEQQSEEFALKREANLRLTLGGSHFRINLFVQRGLPGLVVRLVQAQLPTLDGLELPASLSNLVLKKRGLFLCAGNSEPGRAALLAALVDHRNASAPGHIVVIDDPIAYVHTNKQCVVTQREVPFDTHCSRDALRNAVRQASDLVAISEIRDAESMEAALAVAEAGGLCLAGLSADSPVRAVERVLGFFPEQRHHEIRARLARVLRAAVGRREIDGLQPGRLAVLEIMLDTPAVVQAIKQGDLDQLSQAMAQSEGSGCRTLESSLLALVRSGRIAPVHALEAADHESALRPHMEKWIHEVHGVTQGAAPELTLRLAVDT
jgi:twitching motility protein PilU